MGKSALYHPSEFLTLPEFFKFKYGTTDCPPGHQNIWNVGTIKQIHDSYHFFANTQVHLTAKNGDTVLMKPFVGQAILRYTLDSQLRNELPGRICEIKARQLGWTVENIARTLHFCLDENRRGFILVDDEDVAAEQALRLGTMLNYLPAWLQPKRRIQNLKHLNFDNPNPKDRAKNPGLNSAIQITVPSSFRGVGGAVCIIISEYAHMDPDRQLAVQMGLVSAIPQTPNTILVYDTTPNGFDESYYPMVMETIEENPKWTKRIEQWKGELSADDVLNGILGLPDCVEKGYPGVLAPAICPWRFHEEYSARSKITPRGELRPMTKAQRGETESTLGKISKYGGEEELELRDRYDVCLERIWWRRRKIDGYKLPGEENKLLAFRQEFYNCIAAGQRVSTKSGFVPIEQVEEGTVTPEGPVVKSHSFGEKPIIELQTYAGRKIRCTPNHWILTTEGDAQAADLLGKSIVLQPPIFAESEYTLVYPGFANTQIHRKITPGLGRLLGYYMADGSFYGGTVGFACDAQDEDVIEDVFGLISSELGVTPRPNKMKSRCVFIQASDNRLIPFFEALGISKKTDTNSSGRKRNVCVPEVIWRSPKHVVREFLKAYFEGDGWRSRTGNTVKSFAKSEEFSRDIQYLLLGFGINSYLSTAMKQMKSGSFSGSELRMRVIGSKRFIQEIGFISKRKSERPPIPKAKRGSGLGRPAKDFLDRDEVVKITPLAEPSEVYDLTIEGRHYYGVNGLTVHNTVDSAFTESGASPFDRECLDALSRMERNPAAIGLFRSEGEFDHHAQNQWQQIRLYAPPEPNERYTMGIDTDVSYESVDSDATVAQVVRFRDNKIVATYWAKVPSHELMKQFWCLYKWYNNCYYAIETAGMGYDLVRRCIDKGMSNVHYYKRYDADVPEPTKYPGWEANRFNRARMDQILMEMLCHRNRETNKPEPLFNIPDAQTIKEIKGLSRQPSGALKSSRGKDDTVDALCIALLIAEDPYSGLIRNRREREEQEKADFEKRFQYYIGHGQGGTRDRNHPSLSSL